MLAICSVALVVIGLGTSLLGSFVVVVLGMAVYGFGSAICDVAMNVEGAAVEKAIGKTIMPLFHASWSAGMVIGTTIGTALVFAHVDIAIHGVGMAVLLLLGAILAPRAIPRVATHADTGEEVAHVSFRDRMGIWLEPRTLAIGLIALGMAFTEGSANDWLALSLVDDRGLENGQAAALFTLFTAAMMVGRIAGGPLIDRFGRVPVLRITGGGGRGRTRPRDLRAGHPGGHRRASCCGASAPRSASRSRCRPRPTSRLVRPLGCRPSRPSATPRSSSARRSSVSSARTSA